MKKTIARISLVVLAVALLGFVASAQMGDGPSVFKAELSGANVVPAVDTAASGMVLAVLDGNLLVIGGTYQGLSTPIAAEIAGGVHIHMAAAGENGGVIFPVANDGGTEGSFSGVFTLSDEQVEALEGSMLYVQIHTAEHNPGELRGQLSK